MEARDALLSQALRCVQRCCTKVRLPPTAYHSTRGAQWPRPLVSGRIADATSLGAQELEGVLAAEAEDEHYGVQLSFIELAEHDLVLAEALMRSPK